MRRWLGRPDLRRYRARFDLPAAEGSFAVTFLGVASILVDDGAAALLTDGFFSRPSFARVAVGRISPDPARITAGLNLAGDGARRLVGVLPVHTHFDHAQDSAVVAERTGAPLFGGRSAEQIGRGRGLPETQIDVVASGDTRRLGAFEVTWIESAHCPPDRFPGPIDAPVVPPVRVKAYRCGEAWSLLLAHDSGRTALIQGSAGFVPGALDGRRADVVHLGVGQLGRQAEAYLRTYWAQTVRAVGARNVVLIHWDDTARWTSRSEPCLTSATISTSPCASWATSPGRTASGCTCPRSDGARTPGRRLGARSRTRPKGGAVRRFRFRRPGIRQGRDARVSVASPRSGTRTASLVFLTRRHWLPTARALSRRRRSHLLADRCRGHRRTDGRP